MTDLALVDIRWISDEAVRCGRDDAANFAEGVGDESGGSVFEDVVEIVRMVVVGLYMLDIRCNGTGKGVVANPRVVGLDLIFLLVNGIGHV